MSFDTVTSMPPLSTQEQNSNCSSVAVQDVNNCQDNQISTAPGRSGSDEDSSDEYGNLVIDLGNDDSEKAEKIAACVEEKTDTSSSLSSAKIEKVVDEASSSVAKTQLETDLNHNKNDSTKPKKLSKLSKPANAVIENPRSFSELPTEETSSGETKDENGQSKMLLPRTCIVPGEAVGKKVRSHKSKSAKKHKHKVYYDNANSSFKSKARNSHRDGDKTSDESKHEVSARARTSASKHDLPCSAADRHISPSDSCQTKTSLKGRVPSQTALPAAFLSNSVKDHDSANDKKLNHGRKKQKRKQVILAGQEANLKASNTLGNNNTKELENDTVTRPKRLKGDKSPRRGLHRTYDETDDSGTLASPNLKECDDDKNERDVAGNLVKMSGEIDKSVPILNKSTNMRRKPIASAETQLKKAQQHSVGTDTSTLEIGVMTDPDALGPCEPGTSVHLDGIVWHETETGVLVVNLTWRNRSYVGTLLDATKHDWASPRLSEADLEAEYNGRRSHRLRSAVSDNTRRKRNRAGFYSYLDDAKGNSQVNSKRKTKNPENELTSSRSSTPTLRSKRARVVPPRGSRENSQQPQGQNDTNGTASESSTCSSPDLIECPHPSCNKRYRHITGLQYHQSHAHGDDIDTKENNTAASSEINSTSVLPVQEFNRPKEKQDENPCNGVTKNDKMDTSTLAVSSLPALKEPTVVIHSCNDNSSVHSLLNIPNEKHSDQQSTALKLSKTTNSNSVQVSKNDTIADQANAAEKSNADRESAEAVQTLLDIQNTSDPILPGLQTSYTVVSKPFIEERQSRGLVPNTKASIASIVTQTQSVFTGSNTPAVQEKDPYSSSLVVTPSEVGLQAKTFVTNTSFANATTTPIVVAAESKDEAKQAHFAYSLSQERSIFDIRSDTSSISVPTSLPHGQKVVKSKTVAVPFDPAFSQVYNASNASSSIGGKISKPTEAAKCFVNRPEGQHASKSDAVLSTLGSSVISSVASSAYPSHTNQNIVFDQSKRNSVIVNKVQELTEQNLRLPPQLHGNKKLPGIILPISTSSVGQIGNNVTVTGTFHPHPDPHKPQTAFSAQARDRLRTNRTPSPSSLSPFLRNSITGPKPRQPENNIESKVCSDEKLKPSVNESPKICSSVEPKSECDDKKIQNQGSVQVKPNPLYRSYGYGHHAMMALNNIQHKVESAVDDFYSAELAKTKKANSPNNQAVIQDESLSGAYIQNRLNIHSNSTSAQSAKESTAKESKDVHLALPKENCLPIKLSSEIETSKNQEINRLSPRLPPVSGVSILQLAGHNSAITDNAYQQAIALVQTQAHYAADPKYRHEYEQYMQELQKQHYLHRQQSLSQQQGDKRPARIKDGNKAVIINQQNTGSQDQGKETPKPNPARAPQQEFKDRIISLTPDLHYRADLAVRGNFHSSQMKPQTPLTLGGLPVSTTRPDSAQLLKKHNVKEEPSSNVKTQLTVKVEKTANMPKEKASTPQEFKSSGHSQPLPYLYYPQAFDISRQPYAIAGISPGYVFPATGPAVFPPQRMWPPPGSNSLIARDDSASEPTKRGSPNHSRSPLKNEESHKMTEMKLKESIAIPVSRHPHSNHGSSHPSSKPSQSPVEKALKPSAASPRKTTYSPLSIGERRPNSPPTQRHHHTHHHIHNLYQPPYPYAAPPVLAGTEGVPPTYPIYQKRE